MTIPTKPNGTPNTLAIAPANWQWFVVIFVVVGWLGAAFGAMVWLDDRSHNRDLASKEEFRALLATTAATLERHLAESMLDNQKDHEVIKANMKAGFDGLPPKYLIDRVDNVEALAEKTETIVDRHDDEIRKNGHEIDSKSQMFENAAEDMKTMLEEMRDWMRRHETAHHGRPTPTPTKP